jgi:anti-sigma regulatory factor (Ser/Thr protein kinase)
MSKKPPPKVELTIPIIHDMELAATKTAEVVAKHMGLDEEKSAEISMALIEATINAFEHSNSNTGNVEIHFVIQGDTLLITVSDKGKGFDKSKVKIPKIEEKLSSDFKRGWGLQLIQELMDTVKYESSEEGTTVTMTKKK